MLCFSASRYFTISCSEGASVLCIPITQGTIPCKPYPSIPCITSSQHRKLCQNIPLSKPHYILQYHTKPLILLYHTKPLTLQYYIKLLNLRYHTKPYATLPYPTTTAGTRAEWSPAEQICHRLTSLNSPPYLLHRHTVCVQHVRNMLHV